MPLFAVHCSQAPKRTLVLSVSQTGVAPVQAVPSSPQEQGRQPVSVVPEQMGWGTPALTQLFCRLLHSSCTIQVRPETVMLASLPLPSQMSPISPQLLVSSYQAPGATKPGVVMGMRPMSVSVVASASSCEAVSVALSRGAVLWPQPLAQGPVNMSMSAAYTSGTLFGPYVAVLWYAQNCLHEYPLPSGPVSATYGGKSTM